jgi:hypothetical protein
MPPSVICHDRQPALGIAFEAIQLRRIDISDADMPPDRTIVSPPAASSRRQLRNIFRTPQPPQGAFC